MSIKLTWLLLFRPNKQEKCYQMVFFSKPISFLIFLLLLTEITQSYLTFFKCYSNFSTVLILILMMIISSILLDCIIFKKLIFSYLILSLLLNVFSENQLYISILILPCSHWTITIVILFKLFLKQDQIEMSSLIIMIWGFLAEYSKRRLFAYYYELNHRNSELFSLIRNIEFPIFIFSRNNLIIWKNEKAKEIIDLSNDFKNHMELKSKYFELSINDESYYGEIREILFQNGKYWICYLIRLRHKNILEEGLIQNKYLLKKCSDLLKIMEIDYNKWSNLRTLKYIKQSDMENLAICVSQTNFLKNELYLNNVKTISLLRKQLSTKKKNFNIRNLIVQCIEIASVILVARKNTLSLKFEECFPENVFGDLKSLKEMIILIIRLLIIPDQETAFSKTPPSQKYSISCFLQKLENDNQNFCLSITFETPYYPLIYINLQKVISNKNTVLSNIIEEHNNNSNLLMLIPLVDSIAGELFLELKNGRSNLTLIFTVSLCSHLTQNHVFNDKIPFMLSFCRIRKDENNFEWRPLPKVIENLRIKKEIDPPKIPPLCLLPGLAAIKKEEQINLVLKTKSLEINLSQKTANFEEEKMKRAMKRMKILIKNNLVESIYSYIDESKEILQKLLISTMEKIIRNHFSFFKMEFANSNKIFQN